MVIGQANVESSAGPAESPGAGLPGEAVPGDTAPHGSDGAGPQGPAPEAPVPDEVAPGASPPEAPAVKAPGPAVWAGIRRDDPWAEAGRKAFRLNLGRVLARVPGVLTGEDPEDVHAMRVAARRMRATWRVFGDGFEREARQPYQAELRAIGASLGAVRDLDVQLEILVAFRNQRPPRQQAALEPMLAAWRTERAARHADLIALLGSDRFTSFVIDYQSLADTPGLASLALAPHAPSLLRNRMPARLWDAYQAVWALDASLPTTDLATLHELRIAAKWLRYTLEFVREPLDPHATPLIRSVVALQDHLGAQRDWHVAAERARAFAASTRAEGRESKAIGRFIQTLDAGVARRTTSLDRTWRPLISPEYRRALGRAIARL